MRSTLTTTAVTVALLGLGAVPAAARPHRSPDQVAAANHATTMLGVAVKHQRDAESVGSTPPQTARIVRVPVAANGFDWVDGAIGAGVTAALLLGAAGVGTVRRHSAVTVSS